VVFDDNLTPELLGPERTVRMEAFAIDRTEVTNAAFGMFARPANATSIELPSYPPSPALRRAGGPDYPVTDVGWPEAAAYCRFLGKQLPTDAQWEKAKRGGLELGGVANPMPNRNLPWGAARTPIPARLADTGDVGPVPVGSSPGDVSPYGVLDLAGNVQEWTRTVAADGFVATRGCNWARCTATNLISFMAIANARSRRTHNFELGFRCVATP
jgi:formylglycine-generating enzyme required for sulfatase activity